MVEIGLFYGSSDGNTARVARLIQVAFLRLGSARVELFDIADYYLEAHRISHLILGVPTWNTGQLQADWEAIFAEFESLDLTGRQVALFGLGDQRGYPDTFDALFFVADKARETGDNWPGAGPQPATFSATLGAVEDEAFVGFRAR